MPLMSQMLTIAVRFASTLATLHQQVPKEMLCLEKPERVRRHVADYGILPQHLRAILYVLGDFATGARRNIDFAVGSCYRSPSTMGNL